MWGGTDNAASISAIQTSLNLGVRLIDTAPAYGLGLAEQLVGEAVKGRRQEAVIATKCGLIWESEQGTYFFSEKGQKVYRHLGAGSIFREIDQSLERIGTDYIDIYITHWQDEETPIEETMSAMLSLKKMGKILAIGVSNVSPRKLEEYLKYGPIDVVQEKYSLIDRDLEKELLPICRKNSITVLGYSSLAQGLLAGPSHVENKFKGDDQRLNNPRFTKENQARVNNFFAALTPLKNSLGCTFAQLMIAWTTSKAKVDVALCGARNSDQVRENSGSGELFLNEQALYLIDSESQKNLSSQELLNHT